jgi:hypothetical protein
VTITTCNGEKIQVTIPIAKGNPGNPLSLQDLEKKFHQCAVHAGLDADKAEKLLSQIKELRKISSISRWMQVEVAPLFRELRL